MPAHAWARRRLLLVALAAALAGTALFATRLVIQAVYWSQHRDEPIESWMTIGYVAHSHGVPVRLLQEAAGLPLGKPDRRSLGEISASSGKSFAELKTELAKAIAASRATPSVDPASGTAR